MVTEIKMTIMSDSMTVVIKISAYTSYMNKYNEYTKTRMTKMMIMYVWDVVTTIPGPFTMMDEKPGVALTVHPVHPVKKDGRGRRQPCRDNVCRAVRTLLPNVTDGNRRFLQLFNT